jgi:hypothetical protein
LYDLNSDRFCSHRLFESADDQDTLMKPSLAKLLQEMRLQVKSFRADAQKTTTDLSQIEADYKEVRRKVEPLIQSVEQPRKIDWAGRRKAGLEDRPPPVSRSQPAGNLGTRVVRIEPIFVIPFQCEQYSPFRTNTRKVEIGRAYPSHFRPRDRVATFSAGTN